MDKTPAQYCPNCHAPNKYPDKPRVVYYFGTLRNAPTTFTCGTVTSPDWSPPVYGKDCINTQQRSTT